MQPNAVLDALRAAAAGCERLQFVRPAQQATRRPLKARAERLARSLAG